MPSVPFGSRCCTSICSGHYQADIAQSDHDINLSPCSTGGHFWPSSECSLTTWLFHILPQTCKLFWQLDFITWVHKCVSTGSPEGRKAAAGVVVCYMDSLSEPTESSVPVKKSSWGHCGWTPVTHETRGAPRIMHKRDCFCHENVGFGPDVRMILLLLFFESLCSPPLFQSPMYTALGRYKKALCIQ